MERRIKMKAYDLYNQLEADFRLSVCTDDWSEIGMTEFITEQYKQRYMGLVCDNSDVIEYVYTAVFPSQSVIEKIIGDGRQNALLFVHHPMRWDITDFPAFTDVSAEEFTALRDRRISLYNLHVPLDANGTYGTTWNFAKALNVEVTDEFHEYHGIMAGIIGKTDCGTVCTLRERFEGAVGHKIRLYPYGDEIIADNKVALIAGGGNDAAVYPFLRERGINTYLTGIAHVRNSYSPSVTAHNAARENGVNILAGTHYSTEKFACIKILAYFANLGITGEFIKDTPCAEDM